MLPHQGGRPIEKLSHDTTVINPTLPDMGISRDQSSRWQAIAQLPGTSTESITPWGKNQ